VLSIKKKYQSLHVPSLKNLETFQELKKLQQNIADNKAKMKGVVTQKSIERRRNAKMVNQLQKSRSEAVRRLALTSLQPEPLADPEPDSPKLSRPATNRKTILLKLKRTQRNRPVSQSLPEPPSLKDTNLSTFYS
jgi:hypothetical protein